MNDPRLLRKFLVQWSNVMATCRFLSREQARDVCAGQLVPIVRSREVLVARAENHLKRHDMNFTLAIHALDDPE